MLARRRIIIICHLLEIFTNLRDDLLLVSGVAREIIKLFPGPSFIFSSSLQHESHHKESSQ